jgi:hypothetical protein
MPSNDLLSEYGNWFKKQVESVNSNSGKNFDILIPRNDLYQLDHPAFLANGSSHLWRFRPSAVVIEIDNSDNRCSFHVMLGISNAIALKDVGELNCYVRIMGAKSGCLISPKGVSNEVRLVQAEASVRNRLFNAGGLSSLFLIEWDSSTGTVVSDSVIPIETVIK